MARSRHYKRKRDERDLSTLNSVASPRLLSLPRLIQPTSLANFNHLRAIEDRRTYHPQKHRSAKSLDRSHHDLVTPVTRSGNKNKDRFAYLRLPSAVQFKAPKKVLICIRRKRRKEVLFAFKKTKGGSRRHRRNYFSDIRC